VKALAVVLTASIAVQMMAAVAVYTPPILAPAASGETGITDTAIGLFTAIVFFVSSSSALIGGGYVARYGAVRVSQVGLLLTGAGLALCALAHPLALIAGAIVIGCGYGPSTPAGSAMLIGHTPDRLRNLLMSIRQTGVPLGGAFAGFVVPWIVLAAGWRAALIAMGALCALLALALQAVRADYDRPGAAGAGSRPRFARMMRMVTAHAELRRLTLTAFAYGGMQMCLASYLVVCLVGQGGLGVVAAGAALSAAMIAGIVGRVVWGAVADYTGEARRLLALLGLMMAACALAIGQISSAWPYAAVLALSAVFGATAVGWNGVYIAEIARVAPEGQVAAATGASLALTYLGAVVGPFVFWLIVTATGSYAIAFGAAALVILAAAASMARRMPAAGGSAQGAPWHR
jgi:MFS family permease